MVRLIELEQSSAGNPLKKVKRLYQKLGDIRSLQIFYQVIENYYKNCGMESRVYLLKLSKRILREKNKYGVLEKQISFDKFYEDLEKYTLVKLHNEALRSYVITQIKALNENLNRPTDEGIHLMRKILKDFQYNAKLLQTTKGIESPILEDVQRLKEATYLSGNYNDLRTSKMYLRSLSYKIPLEEQKILSRLKVEWLGKKKLQKEKVLSSIKVLVFNNG
jgi:CHAD domain-containing protein